MASDDPSPIDAPRRASVNPGLYLARVPGIPKLDFRVEGIYTDSSTGRSNGGQFSYWELFYHDAYTNGPVAVALLAQSFGLNLEPSLWADGFMDVHNIFPPGFVPGTNYAFAGATASEDGTIVPGANLLDQVTAYTTHVGGVADPSALYVVMIGGNDASTETFTLGDADTVSQFTLANGLAGVHYWSYDRDTDCPPGSSSPTCNTYGMSGQYGFLKRFLADCLH